MTGIKKYLVYIKPYLTSFVNFGDGARGEIKRVCKLVCTELPRLPRLYDVLLVKGLTANFISINQLCDQGLKVLFAKSECLVTDEKNNVLMRGERSNDNCYLWSPKEESKFCEVCQFRKQTKMA